MIPIEIVISIYNLNDIDSKIAFHKLWGSNTFFNKKRRLDFINSFSEKFIKILSSILQFKVTRIELLNIINSSRFHFN